MKKERNVQLLKGLYIYCNVVGQDISFTQKNITRWGCRNQSSLRLEHVLIYCHIVVGADLHETKPPNEEMLFGNIVEELYRKSHHPEVTSLKSLEPYDPSVPHG